VPTLVMVGAEDQATPVADAEALRDAIPGAALAIIPAAAHIPMAEQPEAVTRAMLDFLTPAATGTGYEAGLATRKQVLGEAHVARASTAITDFDRYFQHYITENAWGGVWSRPNFDRRTRSLLTLAILAALGHHEEFRLHLRATRNTGASPEDIAEMLLHVAVYAGVPAANSAVRLAKDVLKEMETPS
jgi:3-oxoadipate enol-lactonase/4-carboxymuconolactone decarboxylase